MGWPGVCSCERMNRALCAAIVALSVGVVGCSASMTPTGDAATGSTAALCIAHGLCTHAASPAPPGFPQDYCWNGCNWCTCTAAGQLDLCTAQACDAGPRGDASASNDASPANDAAADASVRNDAGIIYIPDPKDAKAKSRLRRLQTTVSHSQKKYPDAWTRSATLGFYHFTAGNRVRARKDWGRALKRKHAPVAVRERILYCLLMPADVPLAGAAVAQAPTAPTGVLVDAPSNLPQEEK